VDHAECTARCTTLAAEIARRKLDAFLVHSPSNVRYLSGFTGSNGLILLAGETPILFTDPRYEIQASQETACQVRVVRGPLIRAVSSALRRKRLKSVGFEKSSVLFETWHALQENLPHRAALHPVDGLVEQQRAVKSPAEIDLIRRAVVICSEAFARAVRRIRAGMREYELAAELDYQMRRLGADKSAFDTIVASGPRSALPHAQPTAKTLASNELLLVDMGAQRYGYASDMTRMLYLGHPTPKVRRLHHAVLNAQLAALSAVRENVTTGYVDRRARTALRAQKLDALFVHSTGHGLGLEIHELPRIGKGDRTRLKAGMVITVEPGIYLEGFGGIRIEDTVLVTKRGCEVLTPTPKNLLTL
jgi:Xaa-Pro aminopeptidase